MNHRGKVHQSVIQESTT